MTESPTYWTCIVIVAVLLGLLWFGDLPAFANVGVGIAISVASLVAGIECGYRPR